MYIHTILLRISFITQIQEVCCHNYISLYTYNTYRVNWVEIDGTIYKLPSALIIKNQDNPDYSTFAKLLNLYVINNIPFFMYKYSFSLFCCCTSVCITQDQMLSHLPHHIRYLPGQPGTLCVVPRYYFVYN